MVLFDKYGVNQNKLVEKANKEKSTITRQIDALEKMNLITRESNNEDKRSKLIYLTDADKQLEVLSLSIAGDITKQSEKAITANELEAFKKS